MVLEDAADLEDSIPALKEEVQVGIGPVIMSLGVIILLNLIEIGYFVFCVYLFNDYIVIIGSAVLVGYSIYSMVKFLPRIREFVKKPLKLLTERI